MIADGKHLATLVDLSFGTTSAGSQAVSFVWTVDGEQLSYMMALTDSTGRPNHFVIQLTRRWVPTWDGHDLAWFKEHREELLGTTATLTMREGRIEWVTAVNDGRGAAPRHVDATSPSRQDKDVHLFSDATRTSRPHGFATASEPSTSSRTVHIDLLVDLSKLDELPREIEPTFENAKVLFDLVTEGTDKLDADKVWTLMAEKIGPMQVDFGKAEWQQMIERIKRLRTWSGRIGR